MQATWRNIVIVVWREHTKVADVEAMSATISRFAREHPEGIGVVQIIETTAVLPPPDSRDALASMLRAAAGSVRCSAVVHMGTGFFAAVVRGVVASLSMIVRHEFPHEVTASISEAAVLLSSHLVKSAARDSFTEELALAAERVRARGAGKR